MIPAVLMCAACGRVAKPTEAFGQPCRIVTVRRTVLVASLDEGHPLIAYPTSVCAGTLSSIKAISYVQEDATAV